MSCVNKNHPEFLKLVKQTGIKPSILAAQIGVWMDINTDERFPTIAELETIPSTRTEYYATDRFKQLGQKYNMNTAGFMPKNAPLDQLQKDAINHGLGLKRAASGSYYFTLGGRKFNPFAGYKQLKSNANDMPSVQLTEKLLAWAKLHGISVIAMEEMMQRATTSGELFEGAAAVADLLNKIIAIDPNKERLDTLAEEIAHFATAMLIDNPSVKRAMDKIVDTDIYKQVKEEYKDIYTEETDFKKEAVDKLLAQAIVEKFEENEQNKGILAYLKAIFNKFFRFFKSLKPDAINQIKKDLAPLAHSILNMEQFGPITIAKPSVYYQIEEEPDAKDINEVADEAIKESIRKQKIQSRKAKFVDKSIANIKDRISQLQRQTGREESLSRLDDTVQDLERLLRNKEFNAAIQGFVDFAHEELKSVVKALEEVSDGKRNMGENNLYMSMLFADMYYDLFMSFKQDMINWKFPQEERESAFEIIKKIEQDISSIRTMAGAIAKQRGTAFIKHGNTDAFGNKIDKSIDYDTIWDETKEDASNWRLIVGNFKFSKSPIIRTAFKILHDTKLTVKRFFTKTANELLSAQEAMEAAGFKVNDFVERDANGRPSQNLIRERNWAEWYSKKDNWRMHIAKELGIAVTDLIPVEGVPSILTKEQQTQVKKLWKQFHKENTITVKQEDGTYKKMPKAFNPEFKRIMANPAAKTYYEALTTKIKEAVDKLPMHLRYERLYYQIPGIRKQTVERMFNRGGSFWENVGAVMTDSVLTDADDTEFGDISALNNRMVPIFFTRRLENPHNLSLDLSRSVALFSQMAENFQQMNKIAGKMELVSRSLAQQDFVQEGKRGTKQGSNDHKILELLISRDIYGIEKKDVRSKKPIKENLLTKSLGIAGKQVSYTKLLSSITKFIKTNNLALNLTTSIAGFLKGSVDSTLEDGIGLHTTFESKQWSRLEYFRQMPEVMADLNRKKKTSKMNLILQLTNILDTQKIVKNSDRSRFAKEILDRDLLYANYRTADYGIKGRASLAVFDNYRLYDGQFVTKEQFIRLQEAKELEYGGRSQSIAGKAVSQKGKNRAAIDAEWTNLRNKSLYNAYEVVDGNLTVKGGYEQYINDALLNQVTGRIEHITNIIDGTMSETDKGQLARTVAGDFLLMHRGWFINMIDTRFNKEITINPITGETQVGMYNGTYQFMKGLTQDQNWMSAMAYYRNLDPAYQRAVKRTMLDLMYLQIIAFLAMIANLAADDSDDEDWTTQYMAYQLNRVLLEQASGQPLIKYQEVIQIIDEPVVGARMIRDLTDFTEMWNTEEYEKGMYEGWSHAQKWWLRKTPFKNIYEMQYPEMKNNFIKQVIGSRTYNIAKFMRGEETNGMATKDLLKNVFISDHNSADDVIKIIEENEE
jgi:hypothetical protein